MEGSSYTVYMTTFGKVKSGKTLDDHDYCLTVQSSTGDHKAHLFFSPIEVFAATLAAQDATAGKNFRDKNSFAREAERYGFAVVD